MTLDDNGKDKRYLVLIVDDVPANIHSLVQILRDDYATVAATSGAKALEIARQLPQPDIILLDIKMPDMDGYAVINQLKASPDTAHIPVMFVTSLDDNADVALGLKLGGVDYIFKPVDGALLRLRLSNHFERQLASQHHGMAPRVIGANPYRKKSILIVDDVAENAHGLVEALKDMYHLNVVTSGPQALEVVQGTSPPDLILLDVRMPGMDGYEVCRRIKAMDVGRRIVIIFVTVASVVDERVKGFNAGAVDYVIKPYDIDEVRARIHNHLELDSLRQHLEMQVEQRTVQLKASEEKFRTIADFTTDWESWIGQDGGLLFMSPSCERITGYRADEFMADPNLLRRIIHPDDWVGVESKCGSCRHNYTSPDQHIEHEFRIIKKSGETRWVEHRCHPVMREDGSSLGCRTSNRDVTSRKKVEEELRLYAMVLENSSEGMMVTNADNNILAVNPAFTHITGYSYEEVLGKNPRIFQSGRHDTVFYRQMWRSLEETGYWQGEIWDKHKDGKVHAKMLTINTIRNKNGEVHRYVALFSDITEKKKAEEMIWQQAHYDPLTKLPNRRLFRDRLEQEIIKAQRVGYALAVLMVDLDEFKEINDTLGHDQGDILLKEAASRLSGFVQATDILARLGGDEFVMLVSLCDERRNIEDVTQSIVDKMCEPFSLDGELVYISASIGITLYPSDATSIESLLKNADQAMYLSKKLGRNRYSYFTPELQEAALKRLRMTNEMRLALGAGQFQVYYQPIVELASGRIYKAEALIRWHHPERGMISPAEFIPLAEQTGMIVEIGDWVFKQSAIQTKRWRECFDAAFQISVNRSPVQFKGDKEYQQSTDYLHELQLPGEAITFEITEGLLLDMHPGIADALRHFRAAGMQISIDDFGTGYSSLSYLRKLHVDFLKIDKSFIDHLEADASNQALCEAIVVMAHKLGIKVIAEGVETEVQRQFLLDIGCDYGQGYLFAKPLPPDEVEKLLGPSRTA